MQILISKFKIFHNFDFNFGTNLGSKYLTKTIFDIKIEISTFEILNVPNVNKF